VQGEEMIQIQLINAQDVPAAADLFITRFKHLRKNATSLPETFCNPAVVWNVLSDLLGTCPMLGAWEGEKMIGYLGWYIALNFRGTKRTAAYCPEWAHTALPGLEDKAYRALYSEASMVWEKAGCEAHAITVLADQADTVKAWFWRGFGMLVVDGVRSIQRVGSTLPLGSDVRKATEKDVPALASLELAHSRHYSSPPVHMAAYTPRKEEDILAALQQADKSYWLALAGGEAAAFVRFEVGDEDRARVVRADDMVAVTGAFTLPKWRGKKFMATLLDAGLAEFAAKGYKHCCVDYEAINPEASAFWPRYFTPVCYSLLRIPESISQAYN
ncbi:MAG TPA: GNAT family N-acetyltransferase, partial [Longilinea sp.]|nr:GNAT family N-acetyltransferase [Longilinea sp.]